MAEKLTDKRALVSFEGPAELLDETILRTAGLLSFPESVHTARHAPEEENPYARLLDKIRRIADNAQIPLLEREIHALTVQAQEEIRDFVDGFYERFVEQQALLLETERCVGQCKNLLVHLRSLESMHVAFERVFSSKYIKVRFGRLPADGADKLGYYGEHLFLFFPFSREGAYLWGVYFTTNEFAREIDNIFDALFFERVFIPDDVRGTPQQALAAVQARLAEGSSRLGKQREQLSRLLEENKPRFLRFYSELRFLQRLHEVRRYASIFSDRFYMTAFAARDTQKKLEAALESLPGVRLEILKQPRALHRAAALRPAQKTV